MVRQCRWPRNPRPPKKKERRVVKLVALKGGPRYPFTPLPLLPSGPGGVHSLNVTRDHKNHASVRGRRERDSNPRYLSVHTISNRTPSAARSSLQGKCSRRELQSKLRTGRDLNPRYLRTSDFESDTIGHSDTCPESSSITCRTWVLFEAQRRTARELRHSQLPVHQP
jgi:hypothetical protein